MGATEVKPPFLADAIVEVAETGSSLRANNLRILEDVLTSSPRLIANKTRFHNDWVRSKIDSIALMLNSCLRAENHVGLLMNVRRANLELVTSILPAIQTPTVSQLSDPDWVAVDTVVPESFVRVIIPQLSQSGAVVLSNTRFKRSSIDLSAPRNGQQTSSGRLPDAFPG